MMKLLSHAMMLALVAAPVTAQTWSDNAPKMDPVHQPEGVLIQPYLAPVNHCPNGLRPVSVGGEISCGTPNTSAAFRDRS